MYVTYMTSPLAKFIHTDTYVPMKKRVGIDGAALIYLSGLEPRVITDTHSSFLSSPRYAAALRGWWPGWVLCWGWGGLGPISK